ncbi:alpha/beta hydrolase [Aspergillus stella-maris]|uniref:alpha/beta hydrolase n=1 Tax=Aspergillus stella-maris TaxID=1810926 RepID=UPI003CCE44B7
MAAPALAALSAKATILLIHGGWHTPAHYSKLTDYLESKGHEVHIPRLETINGARPPNADLTTDTVLIKSYAEQLISKGHRLVVLMHSYGGQVGTNALSGLGLNERREKGLPGGIARLVYITAFAQFPGKTMMDLVHEMGDGHLIPIAFDFDEDGTCVDADPKNLLVGPGLPEEELEEFVGSLVRWNGTAMSQPLENCAWMDEGVNVSYVCTSEDFTVPLKYQEIMVERMRGKGKEVKVFTLETGHCPQVTVSGELGKIVDGIVKGEESS